MKYTKGWTVGYGKGLTGPNTPSIKGVTVAESIANERAGFSDDNICMHIPISLGTDTIAIAVGNDRETNAHLIAAAPEMYEALKRIEMGCSFPSDDVQKTVRDVARAALAKAEGQ